MLTIGAAVLLLLLPQTAQQRERPQPPPSKADSRDVFSIADHHARNSPDITREDLDRFLAGLGVKRKPGDGNAWSLEDNTGEARVLAVFLPDKASVWAMFFPRVPEPIAEPILSSLLREGSLRLDDGDRAVITVRSTTLSVDGRSGTRVETIEVRLTGVHVATRVFIEWPKGK